MEPWVPLAAKNQILMKMEEIVTAYETYPEVITKYMISRGRCRKRHSKTDTAETEE